MRNIAFLTVLTVTVIRPLAAQVPSSVMVPERTITPAEGARGVFVAWAIGMGEDTGDVRAPAQLDTALARRANAWIASLERTSVTGLQRDPMGQLAVRAGSDTLAERQFAERLATPGLSVTDRAYTLLLATRAFGEKASNAARMQQAKVYLAQLDALPVEAAVQQYHGHIALAHAYYDVGDAAQVIAHLEHAMSLVARIPYERRDWLEMRYVFPLLADALSGQPNGRARIDSLTAWLRPLAQASPAMLKDTTYRWRSQINVEMLGQVIQQTSYLGRPAPPITARYWINTPPPTTSSSAAPGALVKALDDGKIRIMEYGHYGCPGCLAALPKMEVIRKTMPSTVETWLVSDEGDVWGATACTPDEMAQHLTQFYVGTRHYGLPIAIWIGPREPDPDGGSQLAESPMYTAYQLAGFPTFIVTDGKGIVRHIGLGDSPNTLVRSVHYLLAEAERHPTTP